MTLQDTINETRDVLNEYQHGIRDELLDVVEANTETTKVRFGRFNGRQVCTKEFKLTIKTLVDSDQFYWAILETTLTTQYARVLEINDINEFREAILEIENTAVTYE